MTYDHDDIWLYGYCIRLVGKHGYADTDTRTWKTRNGKRGHGKRGHG